MRAIVRTHLDTSEAAQQPLDMDLLGPVLEVLSRLDNPPADE
jgi:hypothetical protein